MNKIRTFSFLAVMAACVALIFIPCFVVGFAKGVYGYCVNAWR